MPVNWYFDFVSPFSYLQYAWLKTHRPDFKYKPIPILFAGLLKHWGHKGPAELPAKRIITYRHCIWLAHQHDITFAFPPVHPFNPLACLRLTATTKNDPEVIDCLFDSIWVRGEDITKPDTWQQIANRTGLTDIAQRIETPEIKLQIRDNTDQAIAKQVFGVPTFCVGDKLFWGFDMTKMALDCAENPEQFDSGEYAQLQFIRPT